MTESTEQEPTLEGFTAKEWERKSVVEMQERAVKFQSPNEAVDFVNQYAELVFDTSREKKVNPELTKEEFRRRVAEDFRVLFFLGVVEGRVEAEYAKKIASHITSVFNL
jgi:hypothetical protein